MKLFPGELAIDLGSVNSLIAVADASGEPNIISIPSLVIRYKRSRKVVALGQDAFFMAGKIPDYLEAINPIKEGRVQGEDTLAFVDFMKHLISKAIGSRIIGKHTAVIAVPIIEKAAMRSLKKLVEEEVKINASIISQPGAAAVSETDFKSSTTSTIIDVGGSTADIATVANSMHNFQKSINIGGNHFDETIVKMMKRSDHHLDISNYQGRSIKEQLGSFTALKTEKSATVYGRPLMNGNRRSSEVLLTSQEVRSWLVPEAEKLFRLINESFDEIISNDVFGEVAKHGGIFTGGMAEIPGFVEYGSEQLNRKFVKAEKPFESVIRGTIIIMREPMLRDSFDLLLER